MSKRLKTFVHIPDDQGGYAIFGPDDEVPAWAAERVGDHVWEDDAADSDGPPPKAGKGSSADAWVAYAQDNGVDVDADAKRDDIIAALEAAGVPTE
jgi:hypothetical protein